MVRIFLVAAAVVLALVSFISAEPIGPNCPTCFGNVYSLEVFLDFSIPPLPNGNQVIQVTYTIDTSQSKGHGTFLKAIAFKVSTNIADSAINVIVDAPGARADWSLHVNSSLISSACNASGPATVGTVCVQTSQQPAVHATGGVFQWKFRLELPATATVLVDPLDGEIKALYVNRPGKQKALTSEPISVDVLIADPFPPE
jgi:hypothetical protein